MMRVVPSQVVGVIDQMFPRAATQEDRQNARFPLDRGHQNELAAILKLVDQIPLELINLDADNYNKFVLSVETIKHALSTWHLRNLRLERIPGYGHLNPISLLRRSVALCPDEYPPPETADLDFVSDTEIRDNIRNDIGAAYEANRNGQWKAATVLAGAATEALLLWALERRSSTDVASAPSNPGGDMHRWTLDPYIKVAKELSVIKDETATEATLAKDFRNLIHPGRAVRL
jgi:hypothetical protein